MELFIENNENINLYEYLNLNDFPYKERLFMNKYLRDINFKDESITKDVDYGRLTFHDVLSPKIEKLFDEYNFTVDAIKEIADAAYDIYVSVVINKNLLDFDESYIYDPWKEEYEFMMKEEHILEYELSKDNTRMISYSILNNYFKHITFTTYNNDSWSIRMNEDGRPGFLLEASSKGFKAKLLSIYEQPIGIIYTYDNEKGEMRMESVLDGKIARDKTRFLHPVYLPLSFDYHISNDYKYEVEETPIERIHRNISTVSNQYDEIQTIIEYRIGQMVVKQVDKVLEKDIIEIVHTSNERECMTEIFNPQLSGSLVYNHKKDFYMYSVYKNGLSINFQFKIACDTRRGVAALKVAEVVIDKDGKELVHKFPTNLSKVPVC